MAVQRDTGIRPPPGQYFGDPGTSDDPTPRWLPALGLAIVITLVTALARYAIDLLGIVFLIIVVGFALRAVSDWLTEGDSVSVWSLVAVVAGLAGTFVVGTWLFGSNSLTSRIARPVRVPPRLVQTIDWLEARGWGQRVLLRDGSDRYPGPGDPGALDNLGERAGAAPAVGGRPELRLPTIGLGRSRGAQRGPDEAEAATVPSKRIGEAAGAATRQGVVDTNTVITTVASSVPTGSPVQLTATVRAEAGTRAPRGQVAFYRGREILGVVALQPGPSGATATLSTRTIPAGRHEVVAVYGGTDTFASSRSSALTQVVTPR
jgi:Bacterial Ig-like domain (group 3)